jgi:hypothetical protein
MSLKMLQDWLRSFTLTLRVLQFIWLDGEGPSPLLLDLQPGMGTQQVLTWPVLKEFWFGNIAMPWRSVLMISERAPRCRVVKALRSTVMFERGDELAEESWVKVDVGGIVDGGGGWADTRASSIYSREEGDAGGEGEWQGARSGWSDGTAGRGVEPLFDGVRRILRGED